MTSQKTVRENPNRSPFRMPRHLQCNLHRHQLRSVVGLDAVWECPEVLSQCCRVVDVHAPARSCPWPTVIQARPIGIEIDGVTQIFDRPTLHLCHCFFEEAIKTRTPRVSAICPSDYTCGPTVASWRRNSDARGDRVIWLSASSANRLSLAFACQPIILLRVDCTRDLRAPLLPKIICLGCQYTQVWDRSMRWGLIHQCSHHSSRM